MVVFAGLAVRDLAGPLNFPAAQEILLQPLSAVVGTLGIFLSFLAVFMLLRKRLMRNLPVHTAPTWGCGYALVTSRMQYTAASFAKPIVQMFKSVLCFQMKGKKPQGFFPRETEISSKVVDICERFFEPGISKSMNVFSQWFRGLQSGHTQKYVFYIFFFLLVLLIWKWHF